MLCLHCRKSKVVFGFHMYSLFYTLDNNDNSKRISQILDFLGFQFDYFDNYDGHCRISMPKKRIKRNTPKSEND